MGYKVDKFYESEGKVYREYRKVKINIVIMVKVFVEGKIQMLFELFFVSLDWILILFLY